MLVSAFDVSTDSGGLVVASAPVTAAQRAVAAHCVHRYGQLPAPGQLVAVGSWAVLAALTAGIAGLLGLAWQSIAALVACGASLGVAGLLLHAHTRLKVADAGIFGIGPVAAGMITVAGVSNPVARVIVGIAGAAVATWLLYRLFLIPRRHTHRLTVVVGGLLIGITSTSLLGVVAVAALHDPRQVLTAQVGMVPAASSLAAWLTLACCLVVVAALVWHSTNLNVFYTGQVACTVFGVSVSRIALLTFCATVLLVGISAATSGPLVGVGMLAVIVVRRVTMFDIRLLLPATAAAGVLVVLLAAIAQQLTGVPAGALVAGVSCAVVLWWLTKGTL
ncbi:iron chelate uptake ABC transporter family permease subunit [Corynebacterium choanae]|nr:iron chelate uptake ABC transporter family permease subunit [Corynebacterium choanae]